MKISLKARQQKTFQIFAIFNTEQVVNMQALTFLTTIIIDIWLNTCFPHMHGLDRFL